LAFKPNKKFSTAYHAERNSMASPTQTVVNKDIPNPLIAEDLLKILRDLILFDSSRILCQFPSIECWDDKNPYSFPQ